MSNHTHLDALRVRLSHERSYLTQEKTEDGKTMRRMWIRQIEREIAQEEKFLGIEPLSCDADMTDDELLAALTE
jgi:hypothetical protein